MNKRVKEKNQICELCASAQERKKKSIRIKVKSGAMIASS